MTTSYKNEEGQNHKKWMANTKLEKEVHSGKGLTTNCSIQKQETTSVTSIQIYQIAKWLAPQILIGVATQMKQNKIR